MASANPHKVSEIEALLRTLLPNVHVDPRPSWVGEVIEDADSLAGNARLKARALCSATGQASVADDTGLFVDALRGLPGVRSARFAGEHCSDADNVELLLAELVRVGATAPHQRTASFRTVAIISFPDGSELIAEGRIDGIIATVPAGHRGFGYDPVFVPLFDAVDRNSQSTATFAQMDAAEKNAVSHRYRAIAALAELLKKRLDLDTES